MTLTQIFYNRVNRLRSGWRFTIFVLLLVLTATLLLSLVSATLLLLFGVEPEHFLSEQTAIILQSTVLLTVALGIGWLCAFGLEGLPFASLGWSLHRKWWLDLLYGASFGALSLLLAVVIAWICGGGFEFSVNGAGFQAVAQTVLGSLAIFALGAASEEALFRGYAMQTLARARLAWAAIVILSVFFALVHLGNPNVSPYFTLINTILAGIWLSLAYLKTRSLWFAFGIHWFWNWTMAAILGLPVSGITKITPEPILHSKFTGATWLGGGDYGIEGGAACTVAVLISMLLIYFAPFLRPTEKMLALTDQENPRTQKGFGLPPAPPIFERESSDKI